MKRAFVWMFLVSTTGCIRTYVVNTDEQPGGITGHYVVTQTRMNGNMKVYDCLSKPDGERWNPTCVRADLLLEAPAPK